MADVGLAAHVVAGPAGGAAGGGQPGAQGDGARTITTVLTKPVGRGEYLLGKYLGLSLTLACMIGLMGAIYVAPCG